MAKTYILGHIKPDTDSVVAALALEFLYKAEKCFCHPDAEAVIADPLNPESLVSRLLVSLRLPIFLMMTQWFLWTTTKNPNDCQA